MYDYQYFVGSAEKILHIDTLKTNIFLNF